MTMISFLFGVISVVKTTSDESELFMCPGLTRTKMSQYVTVLKAMLIVSVTYNYYGIWRKWGNTIPRSAWQTISVPCMTKCLA